MSRYIDADKLIQKNNEDIAVSTDFMTAAILEKFNAMLIKEPTVDVKAYPDNETTEDISIYNPVDGFKCKRCGIELRDWAKVEIDDDDGNEIYCEYTFKFCPNCGRKIKR